MRKLIFLGAGGNAAVIYSSLIDINKSKKIKIKPIGFLDDYKKNFFKLKYYGKIEKKNINLLLKDSNNYFIWTLISSKLRKKYIDKQY